MNHNQTKTGRPM